tara:strand:- start:63 stop:455 length:393 start_codon:yes stop_codon:yes gene_type:complete
MTATATASLSIAERIAAVREKHNTSYLSDAANSATSSKSFTLKDYVYLYNKAGYECYIDYMEGAKALYSFMSPVKIPETTYNITISPKLLDLYAIGQLAKIVAGEAYGSKYVHVYNLIIVYTSTYITDSL